MRRLGAAFLALLGSAGLAAAASSHVLPVPRPAPSAAVPAGVMPTAAVGRLNHAGYAQRRYCTVFAIAPKVAVTAAHCVADLPVDELHLLFGYSRMTWVMQTSATAMVPLGFDVMALCLADAAPATVAFGSEGPRSTAVRLLGYGSPKAHVLSENPCSVVSDMMPGTLLVDCAAPQGMSGGPVLDEANEAVAVVSMTGPTTAIAEMLPEWAAEACNVDPARR